MRFWDLDPLDTIVDAVAPRLGFTAVNSPPFRILARTRQHVVDAARDQGTMTTGQRALRANHTGTEPVMR